MWNSPTGSFPSPWKHNRNMESIIDELLGIDSNKNKRNTSSRRFHSTSTMTVPDTLSEPNNELTILAVAERLHHYIAATPSAQAKENYVNTPAVAQPPTVEQVAKYLRQIFQTAQCSVDCTIVCLIYIERLLKTSGLRLTVKNWRSLVAIGMLLASKVHDDLSMVNADFAVFLPFKVDQINAWERQFLAGLKYDVRVSASQYTKLYFDLREEANKNMEEQALHLEQVSFRVQRRMDNATQRRAVSDQFVAKPPTENNELLPAPPPLFQQVK